MSVSKDSIQNQFELITELQTQLQSKINEFIKDKNRSLDDRWEVWTKYANKQHDKYCYRSFPEDRFPGLTDWGSGCDGYPQRYQTVDYEMIVDYCIDEYESTDDIKEYLMEENLGSYKLDW